MGFARAQANVKHRNYTFDVDETEDGGEARN
jgi:hypothetical protein